MYSVYIHTAPNGKMYIGQSSNNDERWKGSGEGYKDNPAFMRDIEIFGWDNIRHEVLIECDTKEKALEFEKLFIVLLDTENDNIGYNQTTVKRDLQLLYANKSKEYVRKRRMKFESKNIFQIYGKSRSIATEIIKEWVLNEKYRYIMERRMLDGVDYSIISSETGLSERQLKRIVANCEKIIADHI